MPCVWKKALIFVKYSDIQINLYIKFKFKDFTFCLSYMIEGSSHRILNSTQPLLWKSKYKIITIGRLWKRGQRT